MTFKNEVIKRVSIIVSVEVLFGAGLSGVPRFICPCQAGVL